MYRQTTIKQILAALLTAAAGISASAATQAPAAADSTAVSPIAAIAASGTENALVLSREECVAIALQSSPTIKVAGMEVKRMDYSKKEAMAGLFPSIDFTGAYQRTIELQTIRMNMGGQSTNIKMGSDNSWNFGFSAQMPIIAPTLWKSIHMSDTQILSAMESARSSRLNMVDQINKAYYALMLAVASRQVVQQNYDIAVFNAKLYERQFAAGTASEYDVLRSSVQVKNVEPELLAADIAVKQSSLALKVLMGMDHSVEIMPNMTLEEMQQEMYGHTVSLTDGILAGNSDLRSLDIQRKLAKQNVLLKKFAWIPTLGASFNISWLSLSNGNALKNQQFNPYSNVGLALSVPIFSGGSKYYGVKQAEVQAKELDLQRENLVNSLNMQTELALDNINRQVRQISSSEEGVKQAVKAHEIMQKSFEIGAATYLNLRDSELAETTARLSYLQSIYNYLVSVSELDLLLGREVSLELDPETATQAPAPIQTSETK